MSVTKEWGKCPLSGSHHLGIHRDMNGLSTASMVLVKTWFFLVYLFVGVCSTFPKGSYPEIIYTKEDYSEGKPSISDWAALSSSKDGSRYVKYVHWFHL